MGVQNSKNGYYMPDRKIFKLSYCIHKNITLSEIKNTNTDLSILVSDYSDVEVLSQLLYYKLKHIGYTNLKIINIEFPYYSLEHIIDNIKNIFIKDLKIKKECYEPNLNNIYHFLNKGRILLAGIILNDEFATEVLKLNLLDNQIVSDIILIVGYNTENIFIKSNWCKDILKVDNKFLNNIKELWNVEISTFNY